ncbi:hypothetical protein K4L06_00955 [Lysobacter sp. BMK333-48F3]|uniref:hypothetical protein n=1 Tax=Lysobacter sp. BMK333-48F3 TaxID=2867962 RepID=UPI001C8BA78B|nr:hypothetical protein [Lysobacter sp. BMK333-48F3]MBX9399862.1 hypothetical protein [Lysobacter sp. BMK333-48F3]
MLSRRGYDQRRCPGEQSVSNFYALEIVGAAGAEMVRAALLSVGPQGAIRRGGPDGAFSTRFPETLMLASFYPCRSAVSADMFRDEGWLLSAYVLFTLHNARLTQSYREIDGLIGLLRRQADCDFVLSFMYETACAYKVADTFFAAAPFAG